MDMSRVYQVLILDWDNNVTEKIHNFKYHEWHIMQLLKHEHA